MLVTLNSYIIMSTENWCKEKHINVIWGELQTRVTRVVWNKENDLDSFLEIALKNNVKNFIVTDLFFEKNLLREKEKELISKIKKYKEQGLPKVAISSKLGISGRMLNKYYFQIE